MGALLPSLFIVGAAAGIVVALFSLWQSLRLALAGDVPDGARARLTLDARQALLTEKEALLQEIRDVAFEHDAGKLSDADFEEINAKLRAQARHLLHELDASAEAFREEAEELISQRLRKED